MISSIGNFSPVNTLGGIVSQEGEGSIQSDMSCSDSRLAEFCFLLLDSEGMGPFLWAIF